MFERRDKSMNTQLLKEAQIQLSEFLESMEGIEILAYSLADEDKPTKFLVLEDGTPDGLIGDFMDYKELLNIREIKTNDN